MACQILASREYVSPRQRALTRREEETRNVAYELKDPRSYAAVVAAIEMAPLATPADVLVPVPDRRGSTRANLRLAKQISRLSGAPVCDALTRRLVVKSSRELRRAGLPPLSVAAHRMLQTHGCPPGRVLFVDNVVTTGGTALAAAEALGVPCAVLAWAWHTTHADPARPTANPTPAVHGWHCIGHAQSLSQMRGPWNDADYLELCVGLSYRDFSTNAVLDLRDSWPDITKAEAQKRLRDGDSSWSAYIWDPMGSRWYTVVEKGSAEDTEHFRKRDQALRRLELIARDMADARVSRLPQWRKEDVGEYLRWFKAQIPNRVDYVRLLWANDPNGAYDGLLADPVSEAEEVFEEVFAESLEENPRDLREAILAASEGWDGIVLDVDEDEDLWTATIQLECKTVGDAELDEDELLPWIGRVLSALAAVPTTQLAFKGRGFGRYKPGPIKVEGEAWVYDDEVTITVDLDPDEVSTQSLVWALSDLDVAKVQKRFEKVCREQGGKGLQSERGDLAKRYSRTPGAPRPKPVGPSPAEIVREEKKQARKVAAELEKNRKARKGRYRFGPRTFTHNGASYDLLYSGKPVGVTFYEHVRGDYRVAIFSKLAWAGPRPSASLGPEAALFHDKTFPPGTPAHAALPALVEKVEAIKKWRAAQKPRKKKAPAKKRKKAAKKKVKRMATTPSKKKAVKKKAPARKAAKRKPKPQRPESEIDIIALARQARGENPLLAW